jgi:glycosyltransferase involved in cell wall biosynthesis
LPTPHRILFVHHRPELGGAPVSLGMLIAHLDRERFRATVYCPPGPSAELFRRSGADVITGPVASFTHIWASYYHGLRWLLAVREPARLPRFRRELSRVLSSGGFDLVHLNDSPLAPAAMIARSHGLPVVWHLRSPLAHGGADRRSRLLCRLIDRTAAAAVAIDSDVASTFRLSMPIDVVHNSVDLDHYAPAEPTEAKRKLGLRPDLVAVGLFGYLYAGKGWPEFLRAGRLLLDRGLPVQLVVVGGGVRSPAWFDTPHGRLLHALGLVSDEETRARELAEELDLADRVRFLPFAADPSTAYQALDVVTLPRRGEGIGRVAIEAAACGRPAVASGSLNGGGVILPGETGLLVTAGDPEALADATARLVADSRLRANLGLAARAHAERNFDPAHAAARVMEIYERVLSSPRR